MMLTDVLVGCGSAERFGKVAYSWISRAGKGGKALMLGAPGLMGVTGRAWWVYQVKTVCIVSRVLVYRKEEDQDSNDKSWRGSRSYSCVRTLWGRWMLRRLQSRVRRRRYGLQLLLPFCCCCCYLYAGCLRLANGCGVDVLELRRYTTRKSRGTTRARNNADLGLVFSTKMDSFGPPELPGDLVMRILLSRQYFRKVVQLMVLYI